MRPLSHPHPHPHPHQHPRRPGFGDGGAGGSGGSDAKVAGVLDALASFRDEVRGLAKSKAEAGAVLKACDALRDTTLVELGVRLEDRPDGEGGEGKGGGEGGEGKGREERGAERIHAHTRTHTCAHAHVHDYSLAGAPPFAHSPFDTSPTTHTNGPHGTPPAATVTPLVPPGRAVWKLDDPAALRAEIAERAAAAAEAARKKAEGALDRKVGGVWVGGKGRGV